MTLATAHTGCLDIAANLRALNRKVSVEFSASSQDNAVVIRVGERIRVRDVSVSYRAATCSLDVRSTRFDAHLPSLAIPRNPQDAMATAKKIVELIAKEIELLID